MRVSKICAFCKKASFKFRKGRGICSPCLKQIAKIKQNVSSAINNPLKYGMKSYIWNYLPYTVEDLRNHIQNQFDSWMNWNNRGKYNSNLWKDDVSSTWSWQIDHIIPQSNFHFTSVTSENFRDCWALENLRCLSSKENVIKSIKESHET